MLIMCMAWKRYGIREMVEQQNSIVPRTTQMDELYLVMVFDSNQLNANLTVQNHTAIYLWNRIEWYICLRLCGVFRFTRV